MKAMEEEEKDVIRKEELESENTRFTMIASLACMVIGFIVMFNPTNEATVRILMRCDGFKKMIDTLKMYHIFLNLSWVSEFFKTFPNISVNWFF